MGRNISKRKDKKVSRSKTSVLMSFIILAIASAFFFALTFFLRKQAGKFIPVSTAYFLETCMQMALMVLVFFLFSPDVHKGISPQIFKGGFFALLAGMTVVIGVGLSYLALRMGFLSSYQAITSPAQIIFAILLGIFLTQETFSLRQVLGTLVAVGGILLIVIK